MPTRPRKPRDKAKVEVAVQIAQRRVLARLGTSCRLLSRALSQGAFPKITVKCGPALTLATFCPCRADAGLGNAPDR